MRMHPTATKLQCHGAFALRSMAAHDDQTTAAVIEAGENTSERAHTTRANVLTLAANAATPFSACLQSALP
eukprot:5336680-Pleurochrysis_carterae.AAC.2